MVQELQSSLNQASDGSAMRRLKGVMYRMVKGRLGAAVEAWRMGYAVATIEERCRVAAEIASKADSQRTELDIGNLQRQHEEALAALRLELQEAQVSKIKEVDLNKDGVVDRREFLEAGGTDEGFDRLDTDGNGRLENNELKQIAEQLNGARSTSRLVKLLSLIVPRVEERV